MNLEGKQHRLKDAFSKSDTSNREVAPDAEKLSHKSMQPILYVVLLQSSVFNVCLLLGRALK